jgi:hypothetical protein
VDAAKTIRPLGEGTKHVTPHKPRSRQEPPKESSGRLSAELASPMSISNPRGSPVSPSQLSIHKQASNPSKQIHQASVSKTKHNTLQTTQPSSTPNTQSTWAAADAMVLPLPATAALAVRIPHSMSPGTTQADRCLRLLLRLQLNHFHDHSEPRSPLSDFVHQPAARIFSNPVTSAAAIWSGLSLPQERSFGMEFGTHGLHDLWFSLIGMARMIRQCSGLPD